MKDDCREYKGEASFSASEKHPAAERTAIKVLSAAGSSMPGPINW